MTALPTSPDRSAYALAFAVALALAACGSALAEPPSPREPGSVAPARLADTGLYADFAARRIARDVMPFTPQYPLWSDGASKRRWIRIPPGTAVDATEPDAWIFPHGTRLWKEFSFGRRVETRYMERRADGSWIFATYRWTPDGTDAVLAPEAGVRGAIEIRPGVSHDLPAVGDCLACHGAGPTPVLGFSALQLSPDRDPLAPHAEAPEPGSVDLPALARPPRVEARTPVGRAAQGYLHGNCASCHDVRGDLASLGLDLTQRVEPSPGAGPLASAVGVRSRYRPSGASGPAARIAAGEPDASALVARISTRFPAAQMPPAGTHLVDEEAVRLVRAWIEELDPTRSNGPRRVARSAPPARTE